MAGYRPKSLNELNDMYDKTITAEKAIIKASRQLHDETESIVPSAAVEAPITEMPKEETKTVEALSSEVDSLINRFKSEMAAPKVKPVEPAVNKAPVVAEPPKTITFDKEPKPAPQIHTPAPAKAKTHYEIELPGEAAEKSVARSDERTELFEDYMKIMSDDDDDFFSKRESFKKKGKKKKHMKSFFSRREPSEEDIAVEEEIESEPVSEEIEEFTEAPVDNAEEDLPVKEVIYSPEVPAEADGLKIEFSANSEEPSAEDEDEFTSFAQEAYEDSEENAFETVQAFEDEAEEETEKTVQEVHPDFDIGGEREEEIPLIPQDIADSTYEDFINSEDIYSYDPNKSNTSPDCSAEDEDYVEEYEEYAQYDEEYDDEVYDMESFEAAYPMPKNKKGLVAGRVILSIILSLLCVSTVAVAALNLVLGVNTGREVFGGKYIFTAESDYPGADILSGDLVITDSRYAEDGEVFAYINYTQQCFMFGKRSGSIVNDSSDVLFIAENNGERVLVLRDDTKGVVESVYPSIGAVVSLCTNYFIPLLAVMLVLGLVIVLLLAFVFKDKEKAYKKMIKKMIKKGVITADEEADYNYTEEEETEDLFSTIE